MIQGILLAVGQVIFELLARKSITRNAGYLCLSAEAKFTSPMSIDPHACACMCQYDDCSTETLGRTAVVVI
jgi:hypothetical protein